MIRSTFLSSAVAVVLLGNPCAFATGQAAGAMQATAKQATPTEAAPFIGQWTLALQGPNGPGTFDLAVKVENDKVVGEIGSEQMPKQAINDVSADKDTLVLSYSFDYQGNAVDATVSLGPAKDGKVPAQISFAGGAYVMSGSATKKDPSK
jgi:hypothetical protein